MSSWAYFHHCLFVCLFVCLLAGLQIYYWLELPENKNFGTDLDHCLQKNKKQNCIFPCTYHNMPW